MSHLRRGWALIFRAKTCHWSGLLVVVQEQPSHLLSSFVPGSFILLVPRPLVFFLASQFSLPQLLALATLRPLSLLHFLHFSPVTCAHSLLSFYCKAATLNQSSSRITIRIRLPSHSQHHGTRSKRKRQLVKSSGADQGANHHPLDHVRKDVRAALPLTSLCLSVPVLYCVCGCLSTGANRIDCGHRTLSLNSGGYMVGILLLWQMPILKHLLYPFKVSNGVY